MCGDWRPTPSNGLSDIVMVSVLISGVGHREQDAKISTLLDFLEKPKALRDVNLAKRVSVESHGAASNNMMWFASLSTSFY